MRAVDAAAVGALGFAGSLAEAVGTSPYGFLTALAGVLAAVVILPAQPIERAPEDQRRPWSARVLMLAGFFAAWALAASWAAGFMLGEGGWLHGRDPLPVHGGCGLTVRLLLPKLLRLAESRTDRLGD